MIGSNIDDITLNSWHPLSAVEDLDRAGTLQTGLLGQPIRLERIAEGAYSITRSKAEAGDSKLPYLLRYGFVWTCLGARPRDLFALPEYDETDRRNVNVGSFAVRTSAPRAVENFLDMAHFAFVHPGYLGEEPYTEITEYRVDVVPDTDEIVARDCHSIRTQRSEGQPEPVEVTYVYRIMQPNLTLLTMASAADSRRDDIVALLVQPVDEEAVIAHMLVSVVDRKNDDSAIRRFQQVIFGQDKPILENQCPKRLPLDPRAETPIRADRVAIAYRRWLSEKGVTYGVIPAGA